MYTINSGSPLTVVDNSYKTFSDVYHNVRICVWPIEEDKPAGRLDLKICKTKRLLLC